MDIRETGYEGIMADCPKCKESNLTWVQTKNKKHWLKRDLGEGQTGKEWHECAIANGKAHILRPFCHECNAKLISCGECPNCQFGAGFCPKCQSHVPVNMK